MTVIIYSTESCPWCKKAKEFLEEHNVKFTEKNVGEDVDAAEEMIRKSGQKGVPVIEAEGTVIVGFDENKLKEILKIK